MIRTRSARMAIGGGLAAAALSVATMLPAQADSYHPGWRVVSARPFGAAADSSYLYTVVAPSATSAWAFGSTQATTGEVPIAEHWNGRSWQAAPLVSGLSGNIAAASAPSAADIWAVTDVTGSVLHYNGRTWSVAKQFPEPSGPLPEDLTGVTAFSPADVWVFGGAGFGPGFGTWHLQGTTWTQVTGTGGDITTASALSPSDIWAVGGDSNAPQDVILHYNGTAWQQASSAALAGVQFSASIVALSPRNVWAAGSVSNGTTSTPYLFHLSGAAWSQVAIPWAVDPSRIAPDGNGGVWVTASQLTAAGSQWWVLHLTKQGNWSRTQIGSSDQLFDITLVPRTTSLWGAGSTPEPSGTGSDAAVWEYGQLPLHGRR